MSNSFVVKVLGYLIVIGWLVHGQPAFAIEVGGQTCLQHWTVYDMYSNGKHIGSYTEASGVTCHGGGGGGGSYNQNYENIGAGGGGGSLGGIDSSIPDMVAGYPTCPGHGVIRETVAWTLYKAQVALRNPPPHSSDQSRCRIS